MASKRKTLPETYRQILEIDMDVSPVRPDDVLYWINEGLPFVELGDRTDVWIRHGQVCCRLEAIHFTHDAKLNVIDVYANVVPACGKRDQHTADWYKTLEFKVVHASNGKIIKLVLVPRSEE